MIINSITGTVTRALPDADGLEIKVSSKEGALALTVPSSRGDLIHILRSARMSDEPITIRYNADDVVIGTETPGLARAA